VGQDRPRWEALLLALSLALLDFTRSLGELRIHGGWIIHHAIRNIVGKELAGGWGADEYWFLELHGAAGNTGPNGPKRDFEDIASLYPNSRPVRFLDVPEKLEHANNLHFARKKHIL